jgi:hypothetical protein
MDPRDKPADDGLHWIGSCDQPATACHDFDVPLTVRHNFVEPMGFE